ncbi:MAG: histidine kinase [Acidovorax sp.]|nr:MAG: histidine kinase [Acidovorax sp.]
MSRSAASGTPGTPGLPGTWRRWHPRGGSLRRLLLVWLLSGLWLAVAVVTAVYCVQQMARQSELQDNTLRVALSFWPSARASVAWSRESRLDGERLAGHPDLPPVPSTELPLPAAQGAVHFYTGQVDGRMARVAAALHRAAGDTPAVVRQVASPWSERWPDLGALARDPGLRTVYALAAALSVLIAVVAQVAATWLRDADVALTRGEGGDAAYAGPSELAPSVTHLRELQQSQSRWIEEQRRFLADATHQLRTPMAVLRTQLQSAIHGDVLAADALQQMLHTVDRASGLANQLLSLTKVEQLKRVGQLPQVDLHAMARDAVMELAPLIAAKRLDFALEGPELSAPGDHALLGELVRNLLANAIHHTPAHGRMGVLLRDGTGQVELLVWDEGPGVDDAVRPRLFQPFSAAKGGVGLGLSICRQIGEAMGAEVDLFNRLQDGRVIGVDAVVTWGQGP